MSRSRLRDALQIIALACACVSCGAEPSTLPTPEPGQAEPARSSEPTSALDAPPVPPEPGTAIAIFAGGCFWCMEPPFDALEGVVSTTSGYTGGDVPDPSYAQVSQGGTGHIEAIQVVYRPEQISYAKLLDVFWRNVDPLDDGGQFCDRGPQYTTAIFALDDQQRAAAEASKQALSAAGRFEREIVTPIRPAVAFYSAEDYHQDYYEKSPLRYKLYRRGCGRDLRLAELWPEPKSE